MATSFQALLRTLVEAEIEFVLVGGYSAVLHSGSQLTRDVDIVCDLSPDGGRKLVHALAAIHPVHRMIPDRTITRSPRL